jgi:hypothetical protein
MFYNVCYDGKEYNGVLRESKRNAEIQIMGELSIYGNKILKLKLQDKATKTYEQTGFKWLCIGSNGALL